MSHHTANERPKEALIDQAFNMPDRTRAALVTDEEMEDLMWIDEQLGKLEFE